MRRKSFTYSIMLIATITLFCAWSTVLRAEEPTIALTFMPPQPPSANIRPGFVNAGTQVRLSTQDDGEIFYTLDGSNPVNSASARPYSNNTLQVPENGVLLVKATVKLSDKYSPVSTFVWFPREEVTTAFWGLNVSLALNGEYFGLPLSEEDTRRRMAPVTKLAKWIRTFGTLNNGLEYVNQIAKEAGLHTIIGVYITNNTDNNQEQIEGLRQILQNGPAPDCIIVGNETSLIDVPPALLESNIDAVRAMVLQQGLVIPIGSVEIAYHSWSESLLEKIDFLGVNIYSGTWDDTPENQMLSSLKDTYAQTLSVYPEKLILLTETGTPYAGGSYTPPGVVGVTQTPSEAKATNYLCGFIEWIHNEQIPSFYFESFDEPVKSLNGGHQIERYFGIMDGNMQIHPFYMNCIAPYITANEDIYVDNQPVAIYPNPTDGEFVLSLPDEGFYSVSISDLSGRTFRTEILSGAINQLNINNYPKGIYLLTVENGKFSKTIKIVKK